MIVVTSLVYNTVVIPLLPVYRFSIVCIKFSSWFENPFYRLRMAGDEETYSVFHEAMARLPNGLTAVRGMFTHSWLVAFFLIVGIIPVESHEAMCQGLRETVCYRYKRSLMINVLMTLLFVFQWSLFPLSVQNLRVSRTSLH